VSHKKNSIHVVPRTKTRREKKKCLSGALDIAGPELGNPRGGWGVGGKFRNLNPWHKGAGPHENEGRGQKKEQNREQKVSSKNTYGRA